MDNFINHQALLIKTFFHLQRFSPENNDDIKTFMKFLQNFIVSLKTTIIQTNNKHIQSSNFEILKTLYSFIPYTRDIYGGLGERYITYSMLFIWYYHFPIPTIKCLQLMLQPHDNKPPLASWKDIKFFCKFIKDFSEKGESDPLIDTCVGLLNHQLDADYKNWDSTLDLCDRKKINPNQISVKDKLQDISLVSKWIPRENSSFHWLFQRCAIQWIRSFKPHYFSHTNNEISFNKAFNKGKKEYRKICSRLSKVIDTLQIHTCSKNLYSINPSNISLHSLDKSSKSLIYDEHHYQNNEHISNEKKYTSDKILNFYQKKRKHSGNTLFYDMSVISSNSLNASTSFQNYRSSATWNTILRQTPLFNNTIPLLDLSIFNNTDKHFFNAASSIATTISINSNMFQDQKRIFAFDKSLHFVNIDDKKDLKLNINNLLSIAREHHSSPDFHKLINNIITAIKHAQIDDNTIQSMKLVLLTKLSSDNVQIFIDTIQKSFSEHFSNTPLIVLWNFGGYDITHNYDSKLLLQNNVVFLSGFSSFSLFRLAHFLDHYDNNSFNASTLQFIQGNISQQRFLPFQQYFSTILQNKN
jgi:hypothetical protein